MGLLDIFRKKDSIGKVMLDSWQLDGTVLKMENLATGLGGTLHGGNNDLEAWLDISWPRPHSIGASVRMIRLLYTSGHEKVSLTKHGVPGNGLVDLETLYTGSKLYHQFTVEEKVTMATRLAELHKH